MKKLLLIVAVTISALLFLFSGCTPGSTPPAESTGQTETLSETPMGEQGTWSIFLYLCGSNLETKTGAAGKNLDELLASDIPDNVHVIIQTGGAKKWRSHGISAGEIGRYSVQNGELKLLESLPLANMGDGGTLESFLSWGVANYPAEKMCVILWDHGSGSIDGVCNDENYGFDAITLPELSGTLETVSESMTDRFECIGFDACLMANYETAVTVAPYARYMIGSEEIEPSGGWDYKALISAIKADRSISGADLGRAVCDGYFEKCRLGEKDATATLSVLDLSRFESLSGAFDQLTGEMVADAQNVKGIQRVAVGAKNTQKYGGSSSSEGFSNMTDLRHFAENLPDSVYQKSSDTLLRAIDEVVLYQVYGSQKSKAGGISFYYPSGVEQNKLEQYYAKLCPSEAYSTYLETVYNHIPENPILFTDRGSIASDGSFQVSLDETSRNYILSIDFCLMEYSANFENGTMTASLFGYDNDIFKDYENLSFHSNFRGIWLALNGCKLYVTPVESTDEYIIFTSPIELNGEKTNLRFAFIWDETYENGGYYKLLGAWNGINPVSGMADKEIVKLKEDDVISVYYPYQTLTIGSNGLPVVSEVMQYVQQVPPGEYVITEEPLESTDYLYQFVITDIFGGKHYSDTAWMHMTVSAEELKKHPLPDGTYAARVDLIMQTEDAFIN